MLGILILALGPAVAQLPTSAEALTLLIRHAEGDPVKRVGPIELAGFNFSRALALGTRRSALVVSTLWDSGILLFDHEGRPINVLKTDEVLRVWTVDLDRDGTLEVLTEERLIRGTGIQLTEFRLYSAAPRLRRLWRREALHYRDAAWTGEEVDRQSFVRIVSGDRASFLEYRFPCRAQECIRRVLLARGTVEEQKGGITTR
jgi:hypothetical protein